MQGKKNKLKNPNPPQKGQARPLRRRTPQRSAPSAGRAPEPAAEIPGLVIGGACGNTRAGCSQKSGPRPSHPLLAPEPPTANACRRLCNSQHLPGERPASAEEIFPPDDVTSETVTSEGAWKTPVRGMSKGCCRRRGHGRLWLSEGLPPGFSATLVCGATEPPRLWVPSTRCQRCRGWVTALCVPPDGHPGAG